MPGPLKNIFCGIAAESRGHLLRHRWITEDSAQNARSSKKYFLWDRCRIKQDWLAEAVAMTDQLIDHRVFVIAIMMTRHMQKLSERMSAFHRTAVINQLLDQQAGEDGRRAFAVNLIKQARIGQIERIDQQRLTFVLGRH